MNIEGDLSTYLQPIRKENRGFIFPRSGVLYHRFTPEQIAAEDPITGSYMMMHTSNHDFYEDLILPEYQHTLDMIQMMPPDFPGRVIALESFSRIEAITSEVAKSLKDQVGIPERLQKPHD